MRASFASLALAALLTAPLAAREVDRQEVDEIFAADVPQERKLYCRDTQVFTMPNGTEVRACLDWRAQNRTRLIRTYAALDGPDEDIDQNLDLARDCFDLAVASQNDPYRERFDEDAFLKGAREQFRYCAELRGLQRANQYKLRIYETGVWVGGR